jgi:hypothetical protein
MKKHPITRTTQIILDRTWTTQRMCKKHGVTPMTINAWRARGMPAVVIKGTARPSIRFIPAEANAWVADYLKEKA